MIHESGDCPGIFRIRHARPEELQELVAIDDEAGALYAEAGVPLVLDEGHPFLVAETGRWADAIRRNLAYAAVDLQHRPVGFIALGVVDGDPYIDQLSVRTGSMRQGIGTALLHRAMAQQDDRPLWLTTYAHLSWNRPFYERKGFVTVQEQACGPELRDILAAQRAALPHPEQRVAMARPCLRCK